MFCLIFTFFSIFFDKNISYIEKYNGLAIQEMHLYVIPASISLAQGILESASGTSPLAQKTNNHFGITCKNTKKKCKPNHCVWHNDAGYITKYRKYRTAEDSWRHHSIWLQKPRYVSLQKYGNDYEKWALGLEYAGYARDTSYAEKLIDIIKKYKLYQYDN